MATKKSRANEQDRGKSMTSRPAQAPSPYCPACASSRKHNCLAPRERRRGRRQPGQGSRGEFRAEERETST
eukprot:7415720-Pyramimonas_sp.AAC.1